MLANVHLYFYDEGAIEARVQTEQIEVLSVTELSNAANWMMRYYVDGMPRENSAIHVNFEFV